MADKRISQLVDRGTIANNDVVPIVVSGATTTNKATISSVQDFMQNNLDLGVTSVGITLGSSGTDVSVSGSPITSSGNITINLPTASAANRGLLSAADWATFNAKQPAGNYVTLDTAQTITAQKTFATSGGSDSVIINHDSGGGVALNITKEGNNEGLIVNKTSGSGNAATIIGTLEATTLVKTGGTSAQFLKADGTIDSSTYVTTDTNQSITGIKSFTNGLQLPSDGGGNQVTLFENIGTIHAGSAGSNVFGFNNSNNIFFGKGLSNGGVFAWNNTTSVNTYTLPDATGTLALTSNLSAYLPLAGGTLTGGLNGTFANFTLGVSADNYLGVFNTGSNSYAQGPRILLYSSLSTTNGMLMQLNASNNIDFWSTTSGVTSASPVITLTRAGAATFSSSVTATSGNFIAPDGTTGVLLVRGGKEPVTSIGEINARLDFGSNDASVIDNIGGRIASVTEYDNGSYTGLAFSTYKQGRNPDLKEALRITSGGDLLIGKTNTDDTNTGVSIEPSQSEAYNFTQGSSGGWVIMCNRQSSDGDLITFRQANTTEGSISVSGTTVSYNGGHLSRYSQTESNEKIDGIVKGTVMSNLDQMAVWINPETGEPYENEQLNCMKISDVEGDKNVAGVFVNWDIDNELSTNDMNIAMTGDMIIRIAEGVVVEKGDLLISAGDGTAKPQSDDLIRSNTIAKVTSNHVTCVYEDGSYCVPCVLMAC